MENLKDQLSGLMNFYSLIDIILIWFFASLAIYYYNQIKPLRKKLKDYRFMTTVSAQTIEDYENQIKLQENKITDLKSAFEDAVAEITELRAKNKQLEANDAASSDRISELFETLRILNKKYRRINQPRDSKGHFASYKPVKKADSELWICTRSIGEYFLEGKEYKQVTKDKRFFYLIGETGLTHIVNKDHFRPVEK